MRVCIVSNLFPPHVIGGYELGCFHLATAAQDLGHDVRVLTSMPTGRLSKRSNADHLDVREVFTPIYEYETALSGVAHPVDPACFGGICPANSIALMNAIKEHKPDALWIFNPLGLGPVGILETAAQSGIATTVHLMDHLDETVAQHQIGFDVLSRWKRAKLRLGAISCSRKTLIHNEIYGAFKRSVVIPNGVRMSKGCQPPKATSEKNCTSIHVGTNRNVLNVIYFGQVEEHKGILQLLNAYGRVRKRTTDIDLRLHIAGSGSNEFEKKLQNTLQDLRIEDSVELHGFLEKKQLENLLDDMHIAAFPLSSQEPFAYVVLEAIQAGLPIVLTRGAGCAEFLPPSYPYLIDDRNDVAELSATLLDIVKNYASSDPLVEELQTTIENECDLLQSCVPKCTHFLAEESEVQSEILRLPSPNVNLEESVAASLASWYSVRHVGNMLLEQQGTHSRPKQGVGRSVERWIRNRIPIRVRQSYRAAKDQFLAKQQRAA